MPEPGLRPSTGITRLLRYHGPLRLPQGPRLTISDHLGWWLRPTTSVDLARCLKDLVRMLTPLPRLERTGSSIDCSPAPNGLPLMAGGSAPARNYRGLLRVHCFSACALAPWLRQGVPQRLQWAISHLNCSSGYRGVSTIPRTGLAPVGLRDPEGLSLPALNSLQTSFRAALPCPWINRDFLERPWVLRIGWHLESQGMESSGPPPAHPRTFPHPSEVLGARPPPAQDSRSYHNRGDDVL